VLQPLLHEAAACCTNPNVWFYAKRWVPGTLVNYQYHRRLFKAEHQPNRRRVLGCTLCCARCGVQAVGCTLWGAGCGVQAVGCCCGVHAVGCMLFEAEHQPNTRHQAPQGCLVRTACSPGCTFSGQPSDQQRPRCMSGIGSDHQSLDPCRTLRARLAAGCLRSAGFAWSTRTAPPPPRPTLPCRA
jgi:hypothetical protein